MKKLTTSFLVCVLFASTLFAGGFQVGTHNARAMGMASAYVGLANDASSIYFNPAGLANVKGFSFIGGTTLIMPSIEFTGPKPLTTINSTVSKTFTPINIYAAYGGIGGLSFGIGVFNPYGLGSEWPSGWAGKSLAYKTELRTFYITPAVSYKFNDQFSVGVAVSYISSSVNFSQQFDIPAIPVAPGVVLPAGKNAMVTLDGKGDAAFAFSAGLLYKATKDLSVGLSYRSGTEIKFTGDATFANLPTANHAALFPASSGKSMIAMPSDLRGGVSYNATQDLTINADIMFVGWNTYKSLDVDFEKNSPAWADSKSPKNWENSMTIRVGGEYRIDKLALRAGYVNDGSPIPTMYMDPGLPGKDRHEFTLGIGYEIMSSLRVDAAFQYISFESEVNDSAVKFNGVYKNSTPLFGFNIAYTIN